jgi:cytochrome P450
MQSIVPSLVPSTALHRAWFPPWRTFRRRRAAFDAWVDGLVAARRAGGDPGTDVLGTLLEARYEDGSPMDDSEIRDQLMTLLLAGYETTATAVAWGVYWLLREPATLARLREELDALGPSPAAEAIVRSPYLGAVVSESLRVEPIVTDVARVCVKPLRVGPWTVPAGELATVNLLAILTDEKLFPEPEKFRPERFLERTFTAAEFLPFGGGARRCLGAAFAEAELAIVLGTIASGWELSLASPVPEQAVRRNITMGPRSGVVVKVGGRRTTAGA